jgi:hypothetical protein
VRTNLIAALGLAMLVGVVFVVTLISQYTGTPPEDPTKPKGQAVLGVPLRFATTEMRYDPGSEDLDKKYFPGFFEVSDKLLKVNFWFKNPNPVPVRFTVRGRSCSACTTANLAVIKPEELAKFERAVAASRLGVGVIPVPDLVTPMAHLALLNSLEWHNLDFERPDESVTVPAAPDADTPTWGVFQVVIKVSVIGFKALSATVGMAAGDGPAIEVPFFVATVGVPPLEVTPRTIEIGEFSEGSAPRHAQLYCWSATRDQSDLIAPAVNVSGNDPFVRVGTPVPFTDDDRAAVPMPKGGPNGAVPRVRGGFRIPVTIYRRVPPAEARPGEPTQPDVGPFERQIGIATLGAPSLAVTVTANVTGIVGLLDGGVIDLKDFNGRNGVEKTVTLVSDKPDLELKLLPEECVPNYLKLTLSPPRTDSGRKYWTVKVVVPAKACLSDLPADSSVVLSGTTGGETIKVKLPVKGHGFVRGR